MLEPQCVISVLNNPISLRKVNNSVLPRNNAAHPMGGLLDTEEESR